jgi:hypothetical protein
LDPWEVAVIRGPPPSWLFDSRRMAHFLLK